MEISQLRAFLAVADELHFGRAAERLHMAQPPLSRTIQQLERELGARLFERNTRSVRLTASGRALTVTAREVLAALDRAEESVHDAAQGETGLVRIAFSGMSTYQLVSALARAVRAARPGIQLELSSQTYALPAMRMLINREMDLALGRWDVVPSGITTEVVMPDVLMLAVPSAHPLSDQTTIRFADVAGDRFISLPPHQGSVMPDRLHRNARDVGFTPNVVQTAPDSQSALALVSAGVGSHLTLGSVSRNFNDEHVVFLSVDDITHDVDLRAAWRGQEASPALEIVLEHLRALGAATHTSEDTR